MCPWPRLSLSLVLSLWCLTDPAASATPPEPDPAAWPRVEQPIPASTHLALGQLENGVRYAIWPHAMPPGRVSLRLLVDVGSLQEGESERGFAHFVEHMAFNGTRNFAPGELIRVLQREGVAFGPHVNAHTFVRYTTYELDLPQNSPVMVALGLRVLRDFADGIQFAPAEVQRERGVILSEDLARHIPAQVLLREREAFAFAGTRIAQRWPLGPAATITGAKPEALRAFYDAWYRPERMILAVAGDLGDLPIAALVREQFATLTARGTGRADPAPGELPPLAQPVATCRDEARAGMQLTQLFLRPVPPAAKTWRSIWQRQQVQAAQAMLLRRLRHWQEGGDTRMISDVAVTRELWHRDFSCLAISLACAEKDWSAALALSEQELRRACQYGFTEAELAFQQETMRRDIRMAAQSTPTLPAPALATQMAEGLLEDAVLAAPDEMEPGLLECVDHLTTAGCQQALRETVANGFPRWWVTGRAAALPKPEAVLAADTASRAQPVEPTSFFATVPWAYTGFGQPGGVTQRNWVEDLDIWQVQFANGVRLNLKRTTLEKGAVRLLARLGTGALEQPAASPGLQTWVGEWVLGGLGKHRFDEFATMHELIGTNLAASCDDDAFGLGGVTRTERLPFALQLLTALIADPSFRPEGHAKMGSTLNGALQPLFNSNDGPLQQIVLPFLAGNDRRLGLAWGAEIGARRTAELQAWLQPALQSGPLELALVGDFEIEPAIMEVARTLGTLPPRQPKPDLTAARTLRFPRPPGGQEIKLAFAKDRPARIECHWPAHDLRTARQRRQLELLAIILEDRVRQQIREEKSATYAPQAGVDWRRAYPGMVHVVCRLEVQPDRAQKYAKAVRNLAQKLATGGVTDDELVRAQAQCRTGVRAARLDNGYWLNVVLADAQEHPERLDEARQAETDYATATKAELDALAGRYLTRANLFLFTLVPQGAAPAKR